MTTPMNHFRFGTGGKYNLVWYCYLDWSQWNAGPRFTRLETLEAVGYSVKFSLLPISVCLAVDVTRKAYLR